MEQLKYIAEGTGGLPALADANSLLTWSELASRVDAFSAELERLPRFRRALVSLPQNASGVALLLAFARGRRSVFPISAVYGAAHAQRLFDTLVVDTRLTLTDDGVIEVQRRASHPDASDDDRPSVYMLTSGTSAAPKCVRHDWHTLSAAVKRRDWFAKGAWLLTYPLSHFAALQVVMQCLENLGTLVVPPDLSPEASRTMLVRHQVRFLSCTPTYMRQLLFTLSPEDWRALSLIQITLGGESADQSLLDAVKRVRPATRLVHTYASTEIGLLLTASDGRAGYDATQLDERRLQIREGELFVRRSARSMLGYLGGEQPEPEDSWIGTGDLVERRDDRLYVLGRRDEIINVAGVKVSPCSVESVIRQVDGVFDVIVTGVRNAISGQLIKANVEIVPGTDLDRLRVAIQRHCMAHLTKHMIPRVIEFGSVQRTITHKLRRGS